MIVPARQNLAAGSDSRPGGREVLDASVVILNNYLRPHHVCVYEEIARRVRKLTVLLGTPMEPDRAWQPEWGSLDVRLQKNFIWRTDWRHPSGFLTPNFIHFPVDTIRQLRRLRPDIVCSAEYGPRTLLAGIHRLMNPRSRLVVIGNMSVHTELKRNFSRRLIRSLIRRMGDRFTYNGRSCQAYLGQLGVPAGKMACFPYCYDLGKVFRGPREYSPDGERTVVFSGFLEVRKGVLELVQAVRAWSEAHPDCRLNLEVCGTGSLRADLESLRSASVSVRFHGHASDETLREVYSRSDVCVFPSLSDEWGLVPVEAMASGVPVVGSLYAQSVEDLVVEGVNGWRFYPDQPAGFLAALDRALGTPRSTLEQMGQAARKSIEHITPGWCAEQMLNVLRDCLGHSG